MDVTTPEQAKIAEDSGAVAVMALERIPADIRSDGGISRMSDPKMIESIKDVVSIPVMAKCRIGHFAEALILESIKVDFIDESEVLTPAVKHMRAINSQIEMLKNINKEEIPAFAKDISAPQVLVEQTAKIGRLPVPNFSAGGIATPADAALMMQLGAESVFVGSGIFKSSDPENRA